MRNSELVEVLGWGSEPVVEAQREKRWVVQDLVAANSTAWWYGPPGSYKTFIALDIAMHVATGRPWMGRETSQGAVLFIAAEGGDDIHIRRAGWEAKHGVSAPIWILPDRPQIDETRAGEFGKVRPGFNLIRNRIKEAQKTPHERFQEIVSRPWDMDKNLSDQEKDELRVQKESLQRLCERADAGEIELPDQTVRLVVIDTFSQTASDDTKDAVNRYITALYDLLGEHLTDAAILVIDHTTKGGDTWMGSQAKLGNVDMMASVTAKGDLATVSMSGGRGKLKGAPAFPDIHVQMQPFELDAADAYGRPLRTLVCSDGAKAKRLKELAAGDTAEATLLEILAGSDGITRSDLRDAFSAHSTNEDKKQPTVSKNFRRGLKGLQEDGLVVEVGELLMPEVPA